MTRSPPGWRSPIYPDAHIRHQAFEESRLADGFYDVALSNVPFGDYPVADSRFKGWNASMVFWAIREPHGDEHEDRHFGTYYSRDCHHDHADVLNDVGLAWTLDRLTRSAVSCMFQFQYRRRAPRHRSALRSGMKAVVLVLGILCFAGEGSAQTIVTRDMGAPTRNIFVISYDDAFCWVGRHYGDQRDFGGSTEPGLFVHSKRHDKWLQIVKVATKGGVFGTSNSDRKEDQQELMGISVGWDFTGLATNAYAELPLLTSGSLAFPDRVEFDEERERYTLGFMTACGVPSAASYLSFDRRDLEMAFAHHRKPEPDGTANRSQPIRAETNRTSAAVGSHR